MADRKQLYQYKGGKCSGCGMTVEEMVSRYGTFKRMFSFHHIDPSTKHNQYSNLMKQRISAEQIAEVDKCALLCTHCHDVIHAQDITGGLDVTIELEGRRITQRFNGWYKWDKVNNSLTFVTNQIVRLKPCRVNINNTLIKILSISEIENDENLMDWLRKIEKYKIIEVTSITDNQLLMRIEHIKDNLVKICQDISFPVTTIDFEVDDGDENFVWIRNGVGLTDKGEIIDSGVIKYTCKLKNLQNS